MRTDDTGFWQKRWREEFDRGEEQHKKLADLQIQIYKLEAENTAKGQVDALEHELSGTKKRLEETGRALSAARERLKAWKPVMEVAASVQTTSNMKTAWESIVSACAAVPPEHRVNLCGYPEPYPVWRRNPIAKPLPVRDGFLCSPDCPFIKRSEDCSLICPAYSNHPEHPQPSAADTGWQCSSACRFFDSKCPDFCPAIEHHPKFNGRRTSTDETAEQFMDRVFPHNWICDRRHCSDPVLDRTPGAWECGLLKDPPGYVSPIPQTMGAIIGLNKGTRQEAIEAFAHWHGWMTTLTSLHCNCCGAPRLLGPSPLCDDCRRKKEGW